MQYAKHIHVLSLLSQIPQSACTRYPDAATSKDIHDAWDHIFEYIHANWAPPATMGAECDYKTMTPEQQAQVTGCSAMLCMPSDVFVAAIETLPPYFLEYLFPVAVARYMLRDLGLALNHRKLKTFTEFHARYGAMVLATGLI